MAYNLRPNRSETKRYRDWTDIEDKPSDESESDEELPKTESGSGAAKEDLTASEDQPNEDLTQYGVKVVDKLDYDLRRIKDKTDCQLESRANSAINNRSHTSARYMSAKRNRQSIGGKKRRKRNEWQNNGYKCDESGCQKTFKRLEVLILHKKYHFCGYTVRPLADEEICSEMNISKHFYIYSPNSSTSNSAKNIYRCRSNGCSYQSPSIADLRKHVHNRHVCPNRGKRLIKIGDKYELIDLKSMFNGLEIKSKTRVELKSNEKSREGELASSESGSDEELPKTESTSDKSKEDLTANEDKPNEDLNQYEVKVVGKSVYYLCRFGGKTGCPFKSEVNSEASIRSHISGHYRRGKRSKQSILPTAQGLSETRTNSNDNNITKELRIRVENKRKVLPKIGNKIKSIKDLNISSDYLKRKRIKNTREEDLPSDQSISDPQTDSNRMNSVLNIENNNKRKVLPKIVNKIKSKKTFAKKSRNELKINLDFETSSEDELPSVQSVSDPQTEGNRMNSIVNNENNKKRKIANKIKSKKTIAKTFKCSEKYCNQRFKHKMLFIKHKNSHKNNANKNSLTKVSPNVNRILDEVMRRVDKIEERLSQQKSRPKEEMNDVNEKYCKNETNEESIELIDLTVDESEDIEPNDMSEQNRNHINTTLIKGEPIAKGLDLNESNAYQSNQLNRSDAKPWTSSLGWRAQIPEIDLSEQFMFTEMTKSIDSVAKKFGNVSQNKYFWALVAKHMTDNGYNGFDGNACRNMFDLFANKYYYLVLANSPDETTANEVYPLFASIHSLDLSQSLSQSSFDYISNLRQLFAQK